METRENYMLTPKALRTLRLFVVVGAVTFTLAPYGMSSTPLSEGSGAGCAADSQPVQVSSDAMRQQLTALQQTVNPPSSPKNIGTGTAVLSIVIDCSGKVISQNVVSSGSDAMARAAKATVNTWTYKPFLLNGYPVQVQTTVTISFSTLGKD
jgi:TonB family protein